MNYIEARKKFEYDNGQLISKVSKRKVGFLNRGYVRVHVDSKQIYAHKIIWFLFNKKLKGTIDHINGVRTDNRIENLRDATYSQNNMNVKKRCHGKLSKFKGVLPTHRNKTNMWRAKISKDKKVYHLGVFETEELAAEAYNKAAIKYHKEFACLN